MPSYFVTLIIRNRQIKKNVSNARLFNLVHKTSWNSAAHEYFSRDISIKVKERKLNIDDLLDDILYFGQNVKAIKLNNSKYTSIDEDNDIKWQRILSLCPYLTSVYFLNKCASSAFLKALQGSDIRLNDLQKLHINNLSTYSLDTYELYLRVNIQYCQTITSLQLRALVGDPVQVKHGGLYKFVSQFPRLTCLKVTNTVLMENCDLLHPEDTVNSILYDYTVVTNDSPDTNEFQPIKNISLTELKIVVGSISISTLRYIVSLLKEVKIFALIIGSITVDEDISVEESETILGNLKASTSEMKRVEVKYECNGRDFYLNLDKENHLKGDYRYKGYFSDGDYYFNDDYDDHCRWNGCVDDYFFYDD
ncbi:hypothetical protein HPULCUR_000258 [Helicostylum pulchrum]|uniref:Uncharacterized protein n=1 Tax=Helicostylum pulchrum TaxID=562976 RepID=A0ABP9XJB9_9FUNG